ncbi:MAG: hypothetical protein LBS88_11670, partial [Tannerellaceae bacterium]|nr:hypothetical protein [Tannerellaceae bacterium]
CCFLGAFDYVDFQFKLSQIQWISIVIARYEAIQGARSGWPPSGFGFARTGGASLRGTKQSRVLALDCFVPRNDEATI